MMQNDSHVDWCSKWSEYCPDHIALKEFESGKTLSYSEWNFLSTATASHLQTHHDIKKGDRIATLSENCLENLILFGAACKLGFILVPLNYRLSQPEIEYLLSDASPSLLYIELKFRELLNEDLKKNAIPIESVIDTAENQHNADIIIDSVVTHSDPVFILYTSGTTGYPKGALYTHGMMFWNSLNTSLRLNITSNSRTINVMPPFHTGGWNVFTTPFLHHGAYTCLLKKFDAKLVLDLLKSEKITLFMGVPTMLKMMTEQDEFNKIQLPDLENIIVGGEPLPIPVIEKWAEKNVMIRQGYGMTEVGPNLTSLHDRDALRKKGSIGFPNFYVDWRIVAQDSNQRSGTESGELQFRGPIVTPGYWNQPKATADAFTDDGWFRTGDIVLRDEEGFFYVIDRIKNMFISGGENVYPAEIERIILQYPEIIEAVIVGVHDSKWGEVGKAFIVPKQKESFDEELFFTYCRAHLAAFKVPKSICLLESIPKNDTGKLDRKLLKSWC
jgi:fatty-acyl-CoA synthase